MNTEDRIKLFRISHSLVERDLDKIEENLKIDLQRGEKNTKDEEYYPQLELTLRTEAAQMSEHYELFYCLEKSIRKLISETLEAQHGENWWDKCIPEPVKTNVSNNIKRELDSGITPRSDDDIDYATFGELGEIVRSNWLSFDAIFSSQKAFTKIMTSASSQLNIWVNAV